MIDAAILQRLSNNDITLTNLTLTVSTLDDLKRIHAALINNKYLRSLKLDHHLLTHQQLSSTSKINIESLLHAIQTIVNRNQQHNAINHADIGIKPAPLQARSTVSFFRSDLINGLQQSGQELNREWNMPRVAQPLSAADHQFLQSLTLQDLLGYRPAEPDFSLKGMIVAVLVGTASKLATEYLSEAFAKNDESMPRDTNCKPAATGTQNDPHDHSTQTDKSLDSNHMANQGNSPSPHSINSATSHDSQHSSPAASHTADPHSSPWTDDSAVKVVGKLMKKQAGKIVIKEIQHTLVDKIKQLPEAIPGISHSGAEEIANKVAKGFKAAVITTGVLNKIAQDPSREGLLNASLEFTKSALSKMGTDLAKKGLLHAGEIGVAIAGKLNPILLVIEGVFNSPEIDPHHQADKPELNFIDIDSVMAIRLMPDLRPIPVGPVLEPQRNNIPVSESNTNYYSCTIC